MRGRGIFGLAAVALLAAAVTTPASGAPATPPRSPVPGSGCTVFPSNNVWNMDVSRLPLNPKSAMWKATMHAGTTNLHPDFGPPHYGIPFNVVANAHPTEHVRFHYASESDKAPYPFGAGTRVEGGSDRHALMINKDTCTLYELFGARWNAGHPTAGSGAIFHLNSDALRPATWTSADAAGLPIFPGLVRWDEVRAGFIGHAIRFTVDCSSRHFIWPARHEAGSSSGRCPPMGARFRLKSGYPLARFGPYVQVVLRAMKRYGLILADNGSDWYFQGTADPHWTYSFVDQLKRIPASAFVAVDESGCRVGANTGQFSYGPHCPAP